MRALSLRQPWLHAVLHLNKMVENRCWSTNYRGPVLLHASLGMTQQYYAETCDRLEHLVGRKNVPSRGDLVFGGLTGRVELVDVIPKGSSLATARQIAERWGADVKWWMPEYNGRPQYGFIFRNLVRFPKVILHPGSLNLFNVPDHVWKEPCPNHRSVTLAPDEGCAICANST